MQGPTEYQQALLGALQPLRYRDGRSPKNIYVGTVSAGEKNRRRAKNRVAKASRRKNRGRR